MKHDPVDGTSAALRDEDRRKVSWWVFLTVVVGVLFIGVAAGFGVSERIQQRELLWRWLLNRSERTVDDVAYRFGELWLKQLRLDADSSDYAVLTGRIETQREHLERLGRAMVDDESAPATVNLSSECSRLYSTSGSRLRADDPYLLPNLRSTDIGGETAIILVNCTDSEIDYYWVDRDGVESYYGRIAPGADVIQHSYHGHIWVVKDAAGVNLSVFRATRSVSLAFVPPTGEPLSR